MLRLLTTTLLVLFSSPAAAAPGALIVVVDPGHGGTALGAIGVTGAQEKSVTRRAALALRQLLQQDGVRVVLTRATDRYLTLSERVRRANRARAHLFVSLHCNASVDHRQRGFEAFVLSPDGVEQQARPLATKPVTVDTALSGRVGGALALSATLADLTRRGLRRRGVGFGRDVIRGLSQTLGARHSRGLRQARFDVLQGLRMPGVLIELGFVDHPVEGRQVVKDDYLRRAARGVRWAIWRYAKRHGLGAARSSAKASDGAGVRPGDPAHHRHRDRRRPPPSQPRLRFRKPEVAFRADRA